MCGFGVSNVKGLDAVNRYCKRRGPDYTNYTKVNEVWFIHNLLKTQRNSRPQPYSKNDIHLVFNGDIYNYSSSELETILEAYVEYGPYYASKLDGEFAICIVDFSKNQLVISSDVFGTKPLWYSINESEFCVASYAGQIQSLDMKNPQKISANTTMVFDMSSGELKQKVEVKEFSTKQFKNSYDDWFIAFENSIKKRISGPRKVFMGLSSGHDSGAIASKLSELDVDFKCFSIGNNEDHDVLLERYLSMNLDVDMVSVDKELYDMYHKRLYSDFEDIPEFNFKVWASTVGLSIICDYAKKQDHVVYLSGSGADEIISDYGYNGKKIMNNSEFGGLFPEDLNEVYPWKNFFGGVMEENLMRDEYVAGNHGIQTRYPFLDTQVVQEFLYLSPKLKNSKYKSVITEYLEQADVPVSEHKTGFMYGSTITNSTLLWD